MNYPHKKEYHILPLWPKIKLSCRTPMMLKAKAMYASSYDMYYTTARSCLLVS